MVGTTWICESAISIVNFVKSQCRSIICNENLASKLMKSVKRTADAGWPSQRMLSLGLGKTTARDGDWGAGPSWDRAVSSGQFLSDGNTGPALPVF